MRLQITVAALLLSSAALTGDESLDAHDVDSDYGSIGRFVYVSRSAHTVFATLRASDSTRDAENFGTALPIVANPSSSTTSL